MRLCRRDAPVSATTCPAKYSLFASARCSASRYLLTRDRCGWLRGHGGRSRDDFFITKKHSLTSRRGSTDVRDGASYPGPRGGVRRPGRAWPPPVRRMQRPPRISSMNHGRRRSDCVERPHLPARCHSRLPYVKPLHPRYDMAVAALVRTEPLPMDGASRPMFCRTDRSSTRSTARGCSVPGERSEFVHAFLWIGLTAGLMTSGSVAAQARVVIKPTPSCLGCEIRLNRKAILGDTVLPGALGGLPHASASVSTDSFATEWCIRRARTRVAIHTMRSGSCSSRRYRGGDLG